MKVLTIRVEDVVFDDIEYLSKEFNKTRAELIREILSEATTKKKEGYLVKKFLKGKITLRTLAKELDIPLWEAYGLIKDFELPYNEKDLARDLRILEEID